MKVKLTTGNVGQIVQADDINGPVIHQGDAGSDPVVREKIKQMVNELQDPDLRKTFARIDPTKVSKELMDQVAALHTKLDNVVKQISPDRKAEVLNWNKNLMTEVQKAAPSPQTARVSASGLESAAVAVAGMAEPIAKT